MKDRVSLSVECADYALEEYITSSDSFDPCRSECENPPDRPSL